MERLLYALLMLAIISYSTYRSIYWIFAKDMKNMSEEEKQEYLSIMYEINRF